MAKKGKREQIYLQCPACKELNYLTAINPQNKENQKKKLELKKYCRRCRKAVLHRETKIPRPKK